MEISKLKSEIIHQINLTDDLAVLVKLKEILTTQNKYLVNETAEKYIVDQEIREFTPWQQAKINKALFQIKNGEVLTEEEAEIDLQQWFEQEEK